jgi:alkanesulfonate monooxygenase SsuD/methylene tetrahydromethanopterin reductase-like flavin-dependent oxidoreductase (luciferase family)
VDETDEAAWEIGGPSWTYAFTENQPLTRLAANRRLAGELNAAQMLEHFTDMTYLRDHQIGLIGSPATVTASLRHCAEEGLFNTLLGEFNFGYLTEEQVTRSMRLFAEEVIPRLREYEPY